MITKSELGNRTTFEVSREDIDDSVTARRALIEAATEFALSTNKTCEIGSFYSFGRFGGAFIDGYGIDVRDLS